MDFERKRIYYSTLSTFLLVFALLLAACQPMQPVSTPTEILPPTGAEPSVSVQDQPVVEGSVTIDEVVNDGPGWIVIHAGANGTPGQVIGHAAVEAGSNEDVVVEIDAGSMTETLYAMLHEDAGNTGEYEFPGPDTPKQVNGEIVVEPFRVTAGPTAGPSTPFVPTPMIVIGTPGTATPVDGTPAVETPETPTLPETTPVVETPVETSPTALEPVNVSAVNNRFEPKELTVPAGTTVIWTNQGTRPHTVTADDGAFNSGTLNPGDTFPFTFEQPGTYPYYCRFHGGPGGQGMSGTITVTGQ